MYNTSMHTVCVKIRVYPTKAQLTKLETVLDTCRLVYNSLLNDRKFQYETASITPSCYSQQKMFPQWSRDFPEVKAVYSQVLQNVAVRVDLAFKAFFRRVKAGETPGYPRLKGHGQYDSFTYPQSGFKIGESTVTLSLIGKPEQVKAKIHRAIGIIPQRGCDTVNDRIKTCTVRRYGSKWYVCFSVDQEDNPLPPCVDSVGLDAGLNSFMALSNGEFINNPRFFRKDEKVLAKAGKKQAKTAKGSRERKKAHKVLRSIHERIKNRRHDFVHQTARRMVNRFGIIAVEKLNVKNMLGNHCLAKSISDASWSMFRSVLTQKAESAGREIYAVNPAYTSQDCHACGYRAKKKLSERWHHCPMCGVSLDRDTNAAINLLNLAISQSSNHSGITLCQVTPVEAPGFSHGE